MSKKFLTTIVDFLQSFEDSFDFYLAADVFAYVGGQAGNRFTKGKGDVGKG
jgi:predicted TPR repeat methyltransferase